MQVVVARTELKVPVGSEGRELELLLLPTPRCAQARWWLHWQGKEQRRS